MQQDWECGEERRGGGGGGSKRAGPASLARSQPDAWAPLRPPPPPPLHRRATPDDTPPPEATPSPSSPPPPSPATPPPPQTPRGPKDQSTTALVTGLVSIIIGVAYLFLVAALNNRGELLPPPPEAYGP